MAARGLSFLNPQLENRASVFVALHKVSCLSRVWEAYFSSVSGSNGIFKAR